MKKMRVRLATKLKTEETLTYRCKQLEFQLKNAHATIDRLEESRELDNTSLRRITGTHKEMIALCDRQAEELKSERAKCAKLLSALNWIVRKRCLRAGNEIAMKGESGVGLRKHRKSGYSTKSPRMRHLLKIEAYRAAPSRNRSRIVDPKAKVSDLFSKR